MAGFPEYYPVVPQTRIVKKRMSDEMHALPHCCQSCGIQAYLHRPLGLSASVWAETMDALDEVILPSPKSAFIHRRSSIVYSESRQTVKAVP